MKNLSLRCTFLCTGLSAYFRINFKCCAVWCGFTAVCMHIFPCSTANVTVQNYTVQNNNSSKKYLPCIMEIIEKLPTKFERIVYPWKRAFFFVRGIILFS